MFQLSLPIGAIIAVLVLGTALTVLECFIPGFGIAGFFGITLSVAGFAMLIPYIGWYTVFVALCELTVILICVLLFAHSAGRGSNPLILNARTDKSSGFSANGNDNSLIGKICIAECDLRPAGIATVDGKRIDVVSDGEFIKKGSSVVVTEVNGRKITVKSTDNVLK